MTLSQWSSALLRTDLLARVLAAEPSSEDCRLWCSSRPARPAPATAPESPEFQPRKHAGALLSPSSGHPITCRTVAEASLACVPLRQPCGCLSSPAARGRLAASAQSARGFSGRWTGRALLRAPPPRARGPCSPRLRPAPPRWPCCAGSAAQSGPCPRWAFRASTASRSRMSLRSRCTGRSEVASRHRGSRSPRRGLSP